LEYAKVKREDFTLGFPIIGVKVADEIKESRLRYGLREGVVHGN
jgi:hypothetical protein